MSRALRIEYSDAWYHVMNRGRRCDGIFIGKQDYERGKGAGGQVYIALHKKATYSSIEKDVRDLGPEMELFGYSRQIGSGLFF